MKTVIITEKKSVGMDYAKVLGVSGSGEGGYIENDKYIIGWCVGHLVELAEPEAYGEEFKTWNLSTLPIMPEKWKYGVKTKTSSQFKVLKTILNRADVDTILWCGDSAREGEYIGRLVRQMAGVNKSAKEYRVWLDSQTDEEIRRGIKEAKPLSLYDSIAASAYERAREDWLMGMNFSRALTTKYQRVYNAALFGDQSGVDKDKRKRLICAIGRVMTCVLGMIVDKERSIRDFKATTYYKVLADSNQIEGMTSEWVEYDSSQYAGNPKIYNKKGFLDKSDADQFVQRLNGLGELTVTDVQKKTEQKPAPQLFNLAELQNECTQRFKFSPDKTLEIAQALYEKKVTTYPRTDARVLTTAIADVIEKNIKGISARYPIATEILSNTSYKDVLKSKRYVDNFKVSDHYAIIPTGQLVEFKADEQDQKDVFDLICKRFLSIFLPPAVYLKVKTFAMADNELFVGTYSALQSPGYMSLLKYESKDPETKLDLVQRILNEVKKGDKIKHSFRTKEEKTQPPKRYTSGSLILAMENAGNLIEDEELRAQIKGSGIGTSATRAGIITKLQSKKYQFIQISAKTQVVTPTNIGEFVYDLVKMTIPSMLRPDMTASWEKGLSQIEKGITTEKEFHTLLENYVKKQVAKIKDNDLSEQVRALGNHYSKKK